MISIDDFMWLFVLLSLVGNILIIKKHYAGFIVWIITNMAWVFYDYSKEIYSQSLLFLVYTVFAIYGFWEWKYKKMK